MIPSSSSCCSEEEASASNELLDAPDIVPPNIFENADLSSSAASKLVCKRTHAMLTNIYASNINYENTTRHCV